MAADPQHSARSGHSSGQQTQMQEQIQDLARKLLDLWQDHLSALAQDPTLMTQALKLMNAYSPFPWPQPGMNPIGGTGFASSPFPGQFPFGFPGPAAGAAPAAATPDAGADSVGELRRRLAELEGRLAKLERAGPKDGAQPTGKRPREPRARTPKGE